MAGFDNLGLYYADGYGDDGDADEPAAIETTLKSAKKVFKEFIRSFHRGGFSYVYRDVLRRQYNRGEYWIDVNLQDLRNFDEELTEALRKKPGQVLPVIDEAAKEVADEVTRPRPDDQQELQDVQVVLSTDENPQSIRSIKSSQVSQLVKLSGIIVSASQVRSKATNISIECRACHHMINNIPIRPGLEGYNLPRRCNSDRTIQEQKCPVDPYIILPNRCKCVDYQTLKLQENPEDVPHGEIPRHLQLYCDRSLTDRLAPGNRVTLIGIYSIRKIQRTMKSKKADKPSVGIRAPYLRVLGIQIESSGLGTSPTAQLSAEEEEQMLTLSRAPDIYDRIARSIAPSIFGYENIKKSIACLLFGGSRKRLPDGLTRRGDINILLLGDPGTAKSQLLKFTEKVSPIGVYTSGKGSSAAGLTASVIRDPSSRGFIMEGGAMVLADSGVVCIDEFDKMREDDRVAIHEAMEQQTISIAKAGITTTLNTRCAVLAAANSIYGKWDEARGDENIDFMPTILSRFDMIFIIKDKYNEQQDLDLARHVIGVHMNAAKAIGDSQGDSEDFIPLALLKKYIHFCRKRCAPRLDETAGQKLVSSYVRWRTVPASEQQNELHITYKKSTIPITVRQLEAIIRISESLAKMELKPFATVRHVDEALRLFQVSTLEAASAGKLAGVEGFSTEEDQEILSRIEKQLKKRFAIGTQVAENVIIQDFLRQRYPEIAITKVLRNLIRRGDIQHRMQRKMLYRIK